MASVSAHKKLNHKLDLLNAGDYARKSNDWAATQNGTLSAPIDPVIPFTKDQIAAIRYKRWYRLAG